MPHELHDWRQKVGGPFDALQEDRPYVLLVGFLE